MTYNTIKNQYTSRLLQAAELRPWRCKFTDDQYVSFGSVNVSTSINDNETGTVLTISGGEASRFTATSYLLWGSEIIQVAVSSDTELTIISRGQFGTAPASHAAGPAEIKHSGEVDGSCFGHPETCSDPNAYDEGFFYQLIFPSQTITEQFQAWSGLESIKYSDPEVDPGVSIGKRGKVTITIRDSVDDTGSWDAVNVPYADRRTTRGTRFAKTIARTKWFENRAMKVWSGFNTTPIDFGNFELSDYIIDSVSHDVKAGVWTFTGLDPLILTEDKKSNAPVDSQGALDTLIDGSSTSFTLKNAVDFEYGQLGDQVPIRFDSEVILAEVTGGVTFDIVQRGFKQPSTQIKDHDVDTTAQLCVRYQNTHIVDVITDLITNYTTMDAAYIGDYTETKNLIPTAIISDAVLTKPKAVKDLINELIVIADLVVWFDRFTNQIEIKVNPEFAATTIAFNERSNISIDSFSYERDLDRQYTRAPVYWGRIDITKDSGEEYFAVGSNVVNFDLEQPDGLGDTNQRKEVFSRWLNNSLDDNQLGSAMSNRFSTRAPNPPIEAMFDVDGSEVGDRTDGNSLQLGTILNVQSSEILNPDGSEASQLYQVLKIQQKDFQLFQLKTRLYQIPVDSNEFDFVLDGDREDFDLSTEFAPAAGNYSILIPTGVTIGQVNETVAMTTGAQATGVTLTIVNRGRILGKGGGGGNGGLVFVPDPADIPNFQGFGPGTTGEIGGDALEITVPTVIDNGGGFIFGGGGGAGGSYSFGSNVAGNEALSGGNGGSTGQGYTVGAAGDRGTAEQEGFVGGVDYGLPGNLGSINAPGVLGSVSGGEYGEAGDGGSTPPSGAPISQALGGASGYAIITNGNSVTFTSGNSPLNLKGGIN